GLLALGAVAVTADAGGNSSATHDGRVAQVYTSGDATAVSGTFTENGFEGVASGPEGRYRIHSDRHELEPLDDGLRRPTRTRHLPNGVTIMEGPGTLVVGDGFGPRPSVGFGRDGSVFVDVPGVHVGPSVVTATPTPREIGRLIRAERYAEAIELADTALRHDRDDAECLQLRALASFLDGDYREASYDVYDALAVEEPFDWDRIDAVTDAGLYTDALRDLQAEATDAPSRADLQLLLAYHGLVLGDDPAACEHLRNVLTLRPREPLALELLDRYDPRPHTVAPSLGDPIAP
ncbi:MAG: hypothetical protein AAF907_13235, partial [Planctomycetota bacterium]